ncbi:MAG: tetratricopeptide repeat protein [Prevotella sp.]|nr:tetratricopeptide repeat protein [Prevotella sp.]
MTPYHPISPIGRLERMLLLLFMLLQMPFAASAITKQDADKAYQSGNYQQAIIDYQSLLKTGISADIYYNLGNAYYRSDSLSQAILAYERALRLSPGDKDISFNLQFARSKTIDKLLPQDDVVFTTWYHSVVNLTSADTWAWVSIVTIVLALILMLVYLFAPQIVLRKIGFFGGMFFLLIFALSNLFAWTQKRILLEQEGAIIIAPSVNVKKTPVQNSADAFILHEGTRVDVTDNSMKQWKGVRLSDGREGWIPADQLEMI